MGINKWRVADQIGLTVARQDGVEDFVAKSTGPEDSEAPRKQSVSGVVACNYLF